jgi:hypothetical protein
LSPLIFLPVKPINHPFHLILHQTPFFRPSAKVHLCPQPTHSIDKRQISHKERIWQTEHIHSCIHRPPDSTALPNRQNQGRASDCCPTLHSSVKSPATFNLSSVMSWSVAKYSGSADRCHSAVQACLTFYFAELNASSTSALVAPTVRV